MDEGTMKDYIQTEGANSAKIIQSASVEAFTFLPKTKSVIEITPDFHIYQTRNKPNRWIRFWHRVLLGWVWRDY